MERTPEGILQFWLGPLREGIETTSEDNWRERMLRWRVGVFARAFEDEPFDAAQHEVCDLLHKQGRDAFFSPAEAWDTPEGWLAKLIVLDQFGRSVHRGTPLAYENDELTAPMIRHICEQGWDVNHYNEVERMWVYIALSHPEDQELQELSVAKWTSWSTDLIAASPTAHRRVNQRVCWYFVKSVIEHSEAVLMHGKFPHRNPIMCRPHRAGEIHYLTSDLRPLWSFTQPPRPLFYALHGALHASDGALDCHAIEREQLSAFEASLELPEGPGLVSVFETLDTSQVSYRQLYRHLCMQDMAPTLDRIGECAALAPHMRKVRRAIFKDEDAVWPPRSAKANVPRVIDVPALNLAIGCAHLSEGDVRIPRVAIDAFVATTGFQSVPIAELYSSYKRMTDPTDATFEQTGDRLRRSNPIDRRQFKQLASCLFKDTPARDQALSTLYELLDMDYDGTVDAGELLVALNALCTGSVQEKLNICFEVFDRDGSGHLDNDELWNLMHTTLLRGLHLVESLFLNYLPEEGDRGGDQVVLFSLANFAAIEQAAGRALEEADTDGDGSVDQAEFGAWAEKHPLLGQLFSLSHTLFGA